MKKLILSAVFMIFGMAVLQAQTNTGPCGNGGGEWKEMIIERLLRNKQLLAEDPVQFRDVIYVPVRFHLVANSSGTGRVVFGRVLEQLCKLNEDYADFDMQFYIKGVNDNINNTAIYNAQYNAGLVMNQLKDPNALNIWIVDVAAPAAPSPGDEGVILGYYNPGRDWVVVRRDQVGASSVTLPHEVGHFFSLDHTHNGWDSTPWSSSIGNPAPLFSPGGVPTERQDGSNCENSGDFICDTPPDYNGFGFNGCNYNIAQDPAGVFINPDEQLFMSYFLNCTRNNYYFSPTQINLMMTDYNHSSRNYLRTGAVTPNLTEITEVPTLTFPINNETTPGYNIVNFQWTAVAGADFYLLEIDRVATFTLNPIRIIVAGANSRSVTTLEANRTYFWRVRPYSAYRTCALSTPVATFKTNSTVVATQEIEALNEWTVSPNPIIWQGALQISLQAEKSFDGDFSLFNAAGQLVRSLGRHRVQSGATYLEFSMEGLSSGVYMLALSHEEGREIRRVVLAK
ncbi:MAG TPA: T9SS type A sorting domain-containing protein [Saprospiraceae bacterium]|nr:T9SS type A sorting domain-containing protein [Saprospiraceae bacterium]